YSGSLDLAIGEVMPLLLISSSNVHGYGYLDHPEPEIKRLLAGAKRVAFVPFAAHEDARERISMVKVYAAEMLGRVADRAVQVFGGMGYCKDLPIERFYRDARIFRIFDGTSEIHRTVIARAMLKHGAARFSDVI